MKRYLILLFACSMAVPNIASTRNSEDTEDTGRSFLGIRPMGQIASPEILSQWRYSQIQEKEDGCEGMAQLVVFGGSTTNGADLAEYFCPFGVRRLRVSENTDTAKVGNFELLSSFFGVITAPEGENAPNPFLSVISLCPSHTEVGVGFGYRQQLWHNEDESAGLYVYITAPIVNVQNKLHFKETILNDGGGALTGSVTTETGTININDVVATYGSMKEAFNQDDWNFGRITCDDDKMSKTGIADITAVLEYRWLEHEPCHIESYAGFLIPTGSKVKGEYMFEPIVGHGQHWGVVWGGNFGLKIWDSEENQCKIRAELTNNSMYLFSKTQMRSFDVVGRPWSRYINVYLNQAQAQEAETLGGQAGTFVSTPGINVFTQPVDVTPGLSHTVNSAFVFDWGTWQGEIGYNFYARASELVELCSFPDDVAFMDLRGIGFTQPLQDIAGSPDDDSLANSSGVPLNMYDRSVITEQDLDLASAATPAILSNILYLSFGRRCEKGDYPLFANVGLSYEFSDRTKAAPQRWGLWFKGGISF